MPKTFLIITIAPSLKFEPSCPATYTQPNNTNQKYIVIKGIQHSFKDIHTPRGYIKKRSFKKQIKNYKKVHKK